MRKQYIQSKIKIFALLVPVAVVILTGIFLIAAPAPVSAQTDKTKDKAKDNNGAFGESPSFKATKENKPADKCGRGPDAVETKINFGCVGDTGPAGMGPIEDVVYAIVRFLSAGVGVVLVISMIIAGIQYSSSEGNAEVTQQSKNRIKNTVIGLVVYVFAFALVQYLVPGGVFSS